MSMPEPAGGSLARRALRSLTSPRAALLIGGPIFWIMRARAGGQAIDLSQVRRVLVVRLDAVGDVAMTTSFLRELRRNVRGAWITLMVAPAICDLVEHCPYVDEVVTYSWSVADRSGRLQGSWRALRLAWSTLWRRRYDLAIVPRWGADHYHASFIAWLSGARWRVGYSENVSQEKLRFNRHFDRLFTHVLNDNTLKHEVEHNLDVIRCLGGRIQQERMELWLGSDDKAAAERFLRSHRARPRDLLIAFGPGAGEPRRRWPVNNFVPLADRLTREHGARIVVVGGAEDAPLGQELRRQLGDAVINAAGCTSLRQACALLQYCDLYVGNDSGPMHLAVAAGLPVVEISCHPQTGSPLHRNSPERFRPWRVPHVVTRPEEPLQPCTEACAADRAHCILGVRVERVFQAAARLLRTDARHTDRPSTQPSLITTADDS